MADLFGDWVPDSWIEEVFAACQKAPQHRYLFFTKNPRRYFSLIRSGKLPEQDNMWYGCTVTGPLDDYIVSENYNIFLSIEPLLEPFYLSKRGGFRNPGEPRWIILGTMTGPGSKDHQPKQEWVESVIEAASGPGRRLGWDARIHEGQPAPHRGRRKYAPGIPMGMK